MLWGNNYNFHSKIWQEQWVRFEIQQSQCRAIFPHIASALIAHCSVTCELGSRRAEKISEERRFPKKREPNLIELLLNGNQRKLNVE